MKTFQNAVLSIKNLNFSLKTNIVYDMECKSKLWSVFEAAFNDLDELTETVTSYISFCEDVCIPSRTHLSYNNKPRFTAKLRQLRQAK